MPALSSAVIIVGTQTFVAMQKTCCDGVSFGCQMWPESDGWFLRKQELLGHVWDKMCQMKARNLPGETKRGCGHSHRL